MKPFFTASALDHVYPFCFRLQLEKNSGMCIVLLILASLAKEEGSGTALLPESFSWNAVVVACRDISTLHIIGQCGVALYSNYMYARVFTVGSRKPQ